MVYTKIYFSVVRNKIHNMTIADVIHILHAIKSAVKVVYLYNAVS